MTPQEHFSAIGMVEYMRNEVELEGGTNGVSDGRRDNLTYGLSLRLACGDPPPSSEGGRISTRLPDFDNYIVPCHKTERRLLLQAVFFDFGFTDLRSQDR